MKRFALPLLALFFDAFLIYPLIGLLGGAFFLTDAQGHSHFTLSFFRLLIENRLYRISLVNSFEIAVLATIFTTLVAIPLAVFFTRYAFPGREWFRPLLLAPLKYHNATGFLILAMTIALLVAVSIFPFGLSRRKRWAFVCAMSARPSRTPNETSRRSRALTLLSDVYPCVYSAFAELRGIAGRPIQDLMSDARS